MCTVPEWRIFTQAKREGRICLLQTGLTAEAGDLEVATTLLAFPDATSLGLGYYERGLHIHLISKSLYASQRP